MLPELTLNLCCVFYAYVCFIKSVWWSTIVCRLCLCACVFLILKAILWFGGCFQTVCFASLYMCMASSLLPAVNFPSRVWAHPGWRSFPTSHHPHPHSAQFTLLLPLDLDGLMLGWGNASKGSAFLTSDPDVSFICRSALRSCGVCLMSGNCRFWSFCQFFGGFFTVVLCARSGPTLAAGQITETALHFLLENIFRNARVLAHHASQVLNNILNVLDNLGLKSYDYGQPFFLLSGSLAPKCLNVEFMESPFV